MVPEKTLFRLTHKNDIESEVYVLMYHNGAVILFGGLKAGTSIVISLCTISYIPSAANMATPLVCSAQNAWLAVVPQHFHQDNMIQVRKKSSTPPLHAQTRSLIGTA